MKPIEFALSVIRLIMVPELSVRGTILILVMVAVVILIMPLLRLRSDLYP